MQYLNFFMACNDVMRKLSDLAPVLTDAEAEKHASLIMAHLSGITGNCGIKETTSKLRDINSMVFHGIRKAFMVPDSGNLSDDVKYQPLTDDPIVQEQCTIVFSELDVHLNTGIEGYVIFAAKLAI